MNRVEKMMMIWIMSRKRVQVTMKSQRKASKTSRSKKRMITRSTSSFAPSRRSGSRSSVFCQSVAILSK